MAGSTVSVDAARKGGAAEESIESSTKRSSAPQSAEPLRGEARGVDERNSGRANRRAAPK
jgi:hypothetical protein